MLYYEFVATVYDMSLKNLKNKRWNCRGQMKPKASILYIRD